jgi:hypothetical protein
MPKISGNTKARGIVFVRTTEKSLRRRFDAINAVPWRC